MQKYLKHTQSGNVIEDNGFINLDFFNENNGWFLMSQQEIDEYNASQTLDNRKKERLEELEIAYNKTKNVSVVNGTSFSFTINDQAYEDFKKIINDSKNISEMSEAEQCVILVLSHLNIETKQLSSVGLYKWTWNYYSKIIGNTFENSNTNNTYTYNNLKAQITFASDIDTLNAYDFVFTNADGLEINLNSTIIELYNKLQGTPPITMPALVKTSVQKWYGIINGWATSSSTTTLIQKAQY